MENIGNMLKEFRLSKELTLQQFAEIAGVHWSTLSKIEQQKVVPSDLTIAKIRNRIPELRDALTAKSA